MPTKRFVLIACGRTSIDIPIIDTCSFTHLNVPHRLMNHRQSFPSSVLLRSPISMPFYTPYTLNIRVKIVGSKCKQINVEKSIPLQEVQKGNETSAEARENVLYNIRRIKSRKRD